ncbi:MAG: FkbM family methyltransferase [Candidatus Pacebacteria bacterium]|nr:FkbM family methyltransferase [Candidatus Paceibacterota bacterium]
MEKTKLGNYIVYYENSEEYHSLKRDVFAENSYEFETDNPSPVIIDAGANIGLSVLYFKKMYPGSKIIAIEPIPGNYKLLDMNVFENNITDVFTYPFAVSNKTNDIELHTDAENNWHSTASVVEGNWTGTQNTIPITVATKPLSYFIEQALTQFDAQYIDLLKMDIEGAEQAVLTQGRKQLREKVKFINCEFHPHQGQNIQKMVRTLEELKFEVTLFRKGKEIRLEKVNGLTVIEAKNLNLT